MAVLNLTGLDVECSDMIELGLPVSFGSQNKVYCILVIGLLPA